MTFERAPCCRVAFIGAGNIARQHAFAFRDIANVKLTGVTSRTRAKADDFAREFDMVVVETIDELYDQTHANLLVITVNEVSIAEVTQRALKFPWTILVEKPPGLNLHESMALAHEIHQTGRNVRVAMNRQSYSTTRRVLHELKHREGARFIHVQDQEDPDAAGRSGKPAKSIHNWMFANSIHLVDYFRLFARGEPNGIQIIQPWNSTKPSVMLARILFSSGDVGLYQAAWRSPGPWAVTITILDERWELRPLESGIYQRIGDHAFPLTPDPWDQSFKPGFRYQAEQAVRAAIGEPSDLPTVSDVLPTMRLIHNIYFPDQL
jgi:predicted dehydrogenase